jgi:hypothetical protein
MGERKRAREREREREREKERENEDGHRCRMLSSSSKLTGSETSSMCWKVPTSTPGQEEKKKEGE